MKISNKHKYVPALLLVICILAGLLFASQVECQVTYPLHSGTHSNTGETEEIMFAEQISAPGMHSLRLYFGDYNLGRKSYVTMTSAEDGGTQRHNARSMQNWGQYSAFFNGDTVDVELHVAPGDEGIYFRIDEPFSDECTSAPQSAANSQCGDIDDRVPSTDSRVGRITHIFPDTGQWGSIGTAFLVSNGALVTVGHNVNCEGRSGSQLCQAFLCANLQFNVPDSLGRTLPVHAAPQDQYPIDFASLNGNWDNEPFSYYVQGTQYWDTEDGSDWGIFSAFPNANNELPIQRQNSFFKVTLETPAVDDLIRITGYGYDLDNYNRSLTQQKHEGPYVQKNIENVPGTSRNRIWHTYRVDTSGGSSGSPIIWIVNSDDTYTIGTHQDDQEDVDCTDTSGGNVGTSFTYVPFHNALQDFLGPNSVYADAAWTGAENGTIFEPYNTVGEAVAAAVSGGSIYIVKGVYTQAVRIDKALTIRAPVGSVIIGQ